MLRKATLALALCLSGCTPGALPPPEDIGHIARDLCAVTIAEAKHITFAQAFDLCAAAEVVTPFLTEVQSAQKVAGPKAEAALAPK